MKYTLCLPLPTRSVTKLKLSGPIEGWSEKEFSIQGSPLNARIASTNGDPETAIAIPGSKSLIIDPVKNAKVMRPRERRTNFQACPEQLNCPAVTPKPDFSSSSLMYFPAALSPSVPDSLGVASRSACRNTFEASNAPRFLKPTVGRQRQT